MNKSFYLQINPGSQSYKQAIERHFLILNFKVTEKLCIQLKAVELMYGSSIFTFVLNASKKL
jgi:hypothetical protein